MDLPDFEVLICASGGMAERELFSDCSTVKEVNLTFRIPYFTHWGQSLLVCGSEPLLGSWNVKKGLLLSPLHVGSELIWRGTVEVQTDYLDYTKPPAEVNLVDWFKEMVANKNPEGVIDPKIQEKPTSRALKQALLVALCCVHPNALKRPKKWAKLFIWLNWRNLPLDIYAFYFAQILSCISFHLQLVATSCFTFQDHKLVKSIQSTPIGCSEEGLTVNQVKIDEPRPV